MIKKLLLAIAIALPMTAAAQSAKFATVDTQALVEAMPETAAANTQIEAAAKKYEDEFKKLQDEFQKKYTEYQQLEETTPQSIKDRRAQELQEQTQRMEQFRATAQQDLARQNETLMGPIQEKLLKAIQTVGANNGYTMIFPVGMSIYNGADVQDATPLVKKELGIQ